MADLGVWEEIGESGREVELSPDAWLRVTQLPDTGRGPGPWLGGWSSQYTSSSKWLTDDVRVYVYANDKRDAEAMLVAALRKLQTDLTKAIETLKESRP